MKNKIWLLPLVVIVLCGLSFWGGTAYEKGHAKTTVNSPAAASRFGGAGGAAGGGRFGSGQRPDIGDVTAVSPTSLTIQDEADGSSKTFSISSSTTFTNNGASATVSDVKTGDRVLVRTSGTGSTAATAIDINPSFGGGQGAQPGGSASVSN